MAKDKDTDKKPDKDTDKKPDKDTDKKPDKKAVKARELLIVGPGGSVPIMDRMEEVLTAIEKNAKAFTGSQEQFDAWAISLISSELARMAGAVEVKG